MRPVSNKEEADVIKMGKGNCCAAWRMGGGGARAHGVVRACCAAPDRCLGNAQFLLGQVKGEGFGCGSVVDLVKGVEVGEGGLWESPGGDLEGDLRLFKRPRIELERVGPGHRGGDGDGRLTGGGVDVVEAGEKVFAAAEGEAETVHRGEESEVEEEPVVFGRSTGLSETESQGDVGSEAEAFAKCVLDLALAVLEFVHFEDVRTGGV